MRSHLLSKRPFGESRSPLECGDLFGFHESHLHPKDASDEDPLLSQKSVLLRWIASHLPPSSRQSERCVLQQQLDRENGLLAERTDFGEHDVSAAPV